MLGQRCKDACASHFAVRERALDDQVAQIADLVDVLPELRTGAGIAGKHQTALPGIDLVADRRHGMVGRQRHYLASVDVDGFAHPDRRQSA
jgi:hypothetical protein